MLTDALAAVLGRLETENRDRDATLGDIFTLRCRLLEALNVTHFRLGKAYGLGRALAFAVAVVVTMILLHSIPPTARLIAALAWLGGTLLAAMKASGALFGSAVKGAEGWLWQTELDESVVQAATRLPPPARHRRITGSSAGAMALSGQVPPAATEMPAATSGR